MATTCDTYTPVIQSEDQCGGEKVNTQCIIDSNTYLQLGLQSNSTQQQINQALYSALIALKNQIGNL